jgi:hypothetical protein
MNFDKFVESIIQEAMARGEFENLPGKGKPLDLTEYFNAPEGVRVAQAMLKNAGNDIFFVNSGLICFDKCPFACYTFVVGCRLYLPKGSF